MSDRERFKKGVRVRRIRGSRLDRCPISLDGGETRVLYEYRGA